MSRVRSSLRQFYLVALADAPSLAVSRLSKYLDECQVYEASHYSAGPSVLLCYRHVKSLRLHGKYTDSSTSKFCGRL